MAKQERIVGLGKKGDHLITQFKPPIRDMYLFEATSSAFSLHKVIKDGHHRRIKAVIYEIGDSHTFESGLSKLKVEIESNTSYSVVDEVVDLDAMAAQGATDTEGGAE